MRKFWEKFKEVVNCMFTASLDGVHHDDDRA